MKILHVSPHPDDEAIASGATLISLASAGHEVDNFAASLGNPGQEKRRLKELVASSKRLGINLIVPDPLPRIESSVDPALAEDEVQKALVEIIDDYDIVISPSPYDLHPGHEAVARAVRYLLRERQIPWWQWGLWHALSLPSILYPFGEEIMEKVIFALKAHGGEIRRNDYRRLVKGLAEANSIVGPEKVFGFGGEGIGEPYAELLTEVIRKDEAWFLGVPRLLDPVDPLRDDRESFQKRPRRYLRGHSKEEEWNLMPDITDWVEEKSITERLREMKLGKD